MHEDARKFIEKDQFSSEEKALQMFIAFHYSTTTKLLWITPSSYYKRYNKELLFGYMVFFKHFLQQESKPSQASFLYISISRNYMEYFF